MASTRLCQLGSTTRSFIMSLSVQLMHLANQVDQILDDANENYGKTNGEC